MKFAICNEIFQGWKLEQAMAFAKKAGYDAEVWLWVRASELGTGLEAELYDSVRRWIEERWPFRRVAYPGRELPLDRYEALRDR